MSDVRESGQNSSGARCEVDVLNVGFITAARTSGVAADFCASWWEAAAPLRLDPENLGCLLATLGFVLFVDQRVVSVERGSQGEGLGGASRWQGVAYWHALRFDCVSLGFMVLPLYGLSSFIFLLLMLFRCPPPSSL